MAKLPPNPTTRQWGKTLRDRRKALGISMAAAAEAAGMTRLTWQRIEKGEPGVTLGFVLAAARVLGMDLKLEMAGEDTRTPQPKPGAQWLPLDIRLADYPGLQRLAWQLRKGVETLTPRQAWELYERNGRHLDPDMLNAQERALMRGLRMVLGGARDDV